MGGGRRFFSVRPARGKEERVSRGLYSTEDPQLGSASAGRWPFGRQMDTDGKGWFSKRSVACVDGAGPLTCRRERKVSGPEMLLGLLCPQKNINTCDGHEGESSYGDPYHGLITVFNGGHSHLTLPLGLHFTHDELRESDISLTSFISSL